MQALEEDIWGDAYKIVTKDVKGVVSPIHLEDTVLQDTLDYLFPNKPILQDCAMEWGNGEDLSLSELETAVLGLRKGKSPGPDGITTEAVAILWELAPEYLLRIMNNLLRKAEFPASWKDAKLILIPKPGKSGTKSRIGSTASEKGNPPSWL